ncbi:MAG: hypothetical protein ACRDIU_00665 [Actinomycetota bacterium]
MGFLKRLMGETPTHDDLQREAAAELGQFVSPAPQEPHGEPARDDRWASAGGSVEVPAESEQAAS